MHVLKRRLRPSHENSSSLTLKLKLCFFCWFHVNGNIRPSFLTILWCSRRNQLTSCVSYLLNSHNAFESSREQLPIARRACWPNKKSRWEVHFFKKNIFQLFAPSSRQQTELNGEEKANNGNEFFEFLSFRQLCVICFIGMAYKFWRIWHHCSFDFTFIFALLEVNHLKSKDPFTFFHFKFW